MASSAIDSGVDTGNDSSDSSVQEKLSKMDLETSPQSKSSDSGNENLPINVEEDVKEAERPSEIAMVDPGPGISFTHLQPSSLMHGYEYNSGPRLRSPLDPIRPVAHESITISSKFPPRLVVSVSPKDIGGVFVSGGPLGTEYRASKFVAKLHQGNRATLRLKCLRRPPITRSSNYTEFRERWQGVRHTRRMCHAACTNNTEAMREMLEAGLSPNPNCHDSYGRTPLHLAACMGYADMVKLLLEHGADPNAKDSIGNTPLHLAACTNHVSVVTLLLRAGTRVCERDLAGHSPLQLAITKFNIMKRSIMPHPVLKEQVCQVITMLTEYMRRREGEGGGRIDPELLNRFESLVRVSDSSEQVETNIRDLLSNLSSLSLSSTS